MAVRDYGNKPIVESEGKKTNPNADTLMASTGALKAGLYEARIIVGASAVATFKVQRRNAANDADVGDVPILYIPAGSSGQYMLTFELATDERIIVSMEANLAAGTAAATLNVERLT